MAPEGGTSKELLISLFATSAISGDGTEYEYGIHSGISIALAAITDGIPEGTTALDPNAMIKRGHEIFIQHTEKYLVDYLEEKFAMDSVEG